MDEKRKAAFDYINGYQKETYDRITILRKKGEKERITAIATARGLSTTQYINGLIDADIQRIEKRNAKKNGTGEPGQD